VCFFFFFPFFWGFFFFFFFSFFLGGFFFLFVSRFFFLCFSCFGGGLFPEQEEGETPPPPPFRVNWKKRLFREKTRWTPHTGVDGRNIPFLAREEGALVQLRLHKAAFFPPPPSEDEPTMPSFREWGLHSRSRKRDRRISLPRELKCPTSSRQTLPPLAGREADFVFPPQSLRGSSLLLVTKKEGIPLAFLQPRRKKKKQPPPSSEGKR